MSLPLKGITILAVEHYGAGPFGTMHLADLGADVIKIENKSAGGDSARHVAPYLLGENDSQFFQSMNRNKRSITLDLKSDEGREIFCKLVKKADGVTSNLRGDQPEKLKLTYSDLSKFNKKIVCAHISAYGRSGPRVNWPGYDYLMQGETGFMYLTGEPEGPPTRMGLSIVDWTTGITNMLGLLSSILSARETGIGRDIDVSLFDTALFQTSYTSIWYLNEAHKTKRTPRSAHPVLVPSQLYKAKDGWLYVMAMTEKFWQIIIDLTGKHEISNNPKFSDFKSRLENRDELTGVLDEVFNEKTVSDWMEIFSGKIPIGPVYDLDKALDNPFVVQREMIQTFSHPHKKEIRTLSNPILVDGQRLPVKKAPLLGEHTEKILDELGYSEDEIEVFKKNKVV
ncbi:MAG: Acetyl-CoA:oxalate CoA-transferase [Alphaproteobacteria bacterium MarineAlpha2_Bin1]|nr:MAG: Acetyl-CoA:oxalate CoA-transferase [Alphaproteobacteria bacterium MarineAlpha2_Bin1]|tara:strand:- start:603 stop:1793 length:1191 start_codon:yes stop_codon:yes gene_type:complete